MIAVYAPGSVSNVACGFDIMGFALDEPGDVVVAAQQDEPGISITAIHGDDGRLTTDRAKEHRVSRGAGALAAARDDARRGPHHSQRLAAGQRDRQQRRQRRRGRRRRQRAAWPARTDGHPARVRDARRAGRLRRGASRQRYAVVTRRLHPRAFGPTAGHCPTAGAGGPVVRGLASSDVDRRRAPPESSSAIRCRSRTATRQWANVGGLVAALYTSDLALLSRSLVDSIAEPKRASLVPGFFAVKQAALDAGALGCSLSGSGPSIFALAASLDEARSAGAAMQRAFAAESDIASDLWVCPVGRQGARVIQIHR